MSKTLAEMTAEVAAYIAVNGWDGDRSFGEDIALLHSEVSEAMQAYRRWGLSDATDEPSPDSYAPKPEGVGSEFADILIRLLDSCARYGVDLAAEYERKMGYNRR